MVLVEVLVIFFITLFITFIFSAGFKYRGPWGALWLFFLIVFLGTWTAQLWLSPIGPTLWEIAWIQLAFVAITFAILLAAASPSTNRRKEASPDSPANAVAASTISVFFWILLFIFLVAIVGGYNR